MKRESSLVYTELGGSLIFPVHPKQTKYECLSWNPQIICSLCILFELQDSGSLWDTHILGHTGLNLVRISMFYTPKKIFHVLCAK